MTASKYPSYKDVPIPWVASIPEHWDWKPVLGAASERDEDNKGMKEDNLLSLSYGNIVNKDINTSDGLLPESFETYQIVRPGDIVLRLTDLQNDKRSLRSALVTQTGIITSAYLALKPDSINPKYLGYLLRAYDVSKVFYSMGGGLRQSMKYGDIKRMPLVIPTKAEQLAIASFLDRETAKIDALIAEQQRLIELLQEKRQAVISHAVTKGLNPNVSMKNSGVEWLGEAPEHWEVKKLSWISSASKGKEAQILTKEYCAINDGDYPVYSGQTSNEGVMGSLNRYEFDRPGGCLLITTVGSQKVMSIRRIAGQFSLSQNCMIASPDATRASSEYLYYALQPCFEFYRNLIPQHMQASFRMEDYYSIRILIPGLDEQRQITSCLDEHSRKVNAQISVCEEAVALLSERRSALISAAVTGQIDVRGLVEAEAGEQ